MSKPKRQSGTTVGIASSQCSSVRLPRTDLRRRGHHHCRPSSSRNSRRRGHWSPV